jgi:carboxymethylenebutenolidase
MTQPQPQGFLAVPDSGNGDPVLVLHAWWGLNETMRDLCTRLAGAGFVAFAPDLYRGRVADTIPAAEALRDDFDAHLDRAEADVAAAIAYLHERAGQPAGGIAVIGFSLGAWFALGFSAADPDHIRSVVIFYGDGPDDFSQSRADYLGHFAEDDDFEPPEVVDGLEAAIRRAGRPVTFYRYPGARHWFFEPDRPEYDPAAAELAWERTLAFLRR